MTTRFGWATLADIFRILLTGSRELTDRPMVIRALSDASGIPEHPVQFVLRHGGNGIHREPFTLYHGKHGTESFTGTRGGIISADAIGHSVWTDWHWVWPNLYLKPEVYEADWNLHGKAAGALRNTQMLEDLKAGERIDFCVAFPLRTSRGTWDMIRKVEASGIPWVNAVATDDDRQRLYTWRELVANDSRNRQEAA